MARVYARTQLSQPASAAEALWYDTSRWAAFIDGFGHVDRVDGDWPKEGSSVSWTSGPGGRGRVVEDVTRYEPRSGQELAVEDERMRGTQRVVFEPGADGTVMTLELVYEVKGAQPAPLRALFDALFVRRPMRNSLTATLTRFRRELASDAELTA